MEIAEILKKKISKSFLSLLHDKLDQCHSDSYYESNRAHQLAIEKFENDFEEYNNSTWIDPELSNYEQEKELIINYVKTL